MFGAINMGGGDTGGVTRFGRRIAPSRLIKTAAGGGILGDGRTALGQQRNDLTIGPRR